MFKLFWPIVLNYIMSRLREPSTWRGLVLAATSAGVALNPQQMDAFVVLGLAVAGCIGAFIPDPKSSYPDDPKPPVSAGQDNANINRG